MMLVSLFAFQMAIANQEETQETSDIPSEIDIPENQTENQTENATEEIQELGFWDELALQKQLRQQKRQQMKERRQKRRQKKSSMPQNIPIFVGRYPLPHSSTRQFSEFSTIFPLPSKVELDAQSFLVGSSAESGLLEIEMHSGSVIRHFASEGLVVGSPTIIDHILFFGDNTGWLYAYHMNTQNSVDSNQEKENIDELEGELLWKKKLSGPIVSSIVRNSATDLSDGILYVTTTDDAVYALQANDASLLWRFQHNQDPSMIGDIPILGQPDPVLQDQFVGCGFSDGAFVLLDINMGQEVQKTYIGKGNFPDIIATPIFDSQNHLWIVSSFDGPTVALDQNFQEVWSFAEPVSSRVMLHNQILYLPSSRGTLYAIDVAFGNILWEWSAPEAVDLTTPLLLDQLLWINSRDTSFTLLDSQTGEEWYTYKPLYHMSGFQNPPIVISDIQNTSAQITSESDTSIWYDMALLSNQGHIYRFRYETTKQ